MIQEGFLEEVTFKKKKKRMFTLQALKGKNISEELWDFRPRSNERT